MNMRFGCGHDAKNENCEECNLREIVSDRDAALTESRREVELLKAEVCASPCHERLDVLEPENADLRQELAREKEYSAETHARFQAQDEQITALRQEVEHVTSLLNGAKGSLTACRQREDALRRQVEEQREVIQHWIARAEQHERDVGLDCHGKGHADGTSLCKECLLKDKILLSALVEEQAGKLAEAVKKYHDEIHDGRKRCEGIVAIVEGERDEYKRQLYALQAAMVNPSRRPDGL